MTNQQIQLPVYSLGMEELCLAFGMINRPDMAQNMMKTIYPDITVPQMKARLMSAGNSMLARNLCTLSASNYPQLSDEFQQAIFPLAKFNYVLHIAFIRKKDKDKTTIHVQNNQFSMHTTRHGIVHMIEHGEIGALAERLLQYFPENESGKDSQPVGIPRNLVAEPGEGQDLRELEAVLIRHGWEASNAKKFGRDLATPKLIASIERIDANNEMNEEQIKQAKKQTLIYLVGSKNQWLLDYPADILSPGTAQQVSNSTFQQALDDLLL